MDKLKKILRMCAGVILAPTFLSLFMFDRLLLVAFPWIESKTMLAWTRNNKEILYSLTRAVFFFICYGIYILIF